VHYETFKVPDFTAAVAVQAPAATVVYTDSHHPPLNAASGQVVYLDAPDTDALLAMMGFASADAAKTAEITPSAASNDPGEAFWQCLVTGCRSGSLVPNNPDGRIHLVAGYVFLRALGIFHQYLTETNAAGEDKTRLQKAFERLGHHRQDNGTMYTCQLYQNEQREGRFKKLSGYLVLASKIFTGDNNPGVTRN
jgi:hypothetical protein